jgi:hypothetical protein
MAETKQWTIFCEWFGNLDRQCNLLIKTIGGDGEKRTIRIIKNCVHSLKNWIKLNT